MAPTTIEPLDWNVITAAIRGGVCVPFLGAGVNASVDGGYRGLPLGPQLALGLVGKLTNQEGLTLDQLAKSDSDPELRRQFKELVVDLGRVRAQDLARVALHVELNAGKPLLLNLLSELIADESREPSELLKTLARQPFRLIVTTNYDRLLERALKDAREPEPLCVVQPLAGFIPKKQRELAKELATVLPADPTPRAKGERTVIYKIHGSLGDPSGELIVSEEDYIEFLDVVSRNPKAGIPQLILKPIVGSSLLFLGYSLEDWDFRTIWKGLVEKLPREQSWQSFAIQKDPPAFWERFWAKKGVKIYNVDLADFADELARRMRRR